MRKILTIPTLSASLLLQGTLACAESDVGAFQSTVTIQGNIGQSSNGANNRQDLNVGSASNSRTRSFNANVSTGAIRQSAQGSGIQQRINVGSMQNSQASTFSATVQTRSIEQVATKSGQRQELDIGSVTNSTINGAANTSVHVGQDIRQIGSGEIVLGSVKNATIGNFNQNLTVQGKLIGNNIRMGSVIGQERYGTQGDQAENENTAEKTDGLMLPNLTKQTSPIETKKNTNHTLIPTQVLDINLSEQSIEYTYKEGLRKKLCYDIYPKYGEGSTLEEFSHEQCNQKLNSYISSQKKYQEITRQIADGASNPETYKALTQLLIDVLPITGTASSFYELITGKSAISNEEASRSLAALGIVLSIIPGAKLTIKFIDGTYDALKIAKISPKLSPINELRGHEYTLTKLQQKHSDDFFSSLNLNNFKKSRITNNELNSVGFTKKDIKNITNKLAEFKKSEQLPYDIKLFVRKPNANRSKMIEEGAVEKPFSLKNKTATNWDYYLNPSFKDMDEKKFKKEILGTVLHYKPNLKVVIDDATEKIDGIVVKTQHYELGDDLKEAAKTFYSKQPPENMKSLSEIEAEFLDRSISRMNEFKNTPLKKNDAGDLIMESHDKTKNTINKFVISDTGQVLTDKLQKITSDIDGFVFLDGNGKPIPEIVHKKLVEAMKKDGILQHDMVSKWELSNYSEGISRLGQVIEFSEDGGYLIGKNGLFDVIPRTQDIKH